ncbi:MAG: hypothetical protein LBB19_02930 [Puniceicoccales bacterium]|jgi:hypothetical protein|nr:hypothetical protein [Puniceicoccales bacterium]
MKIKHYYYIIVGVFCLCLENQTLFGTKIQVPREVMQILQDENYNGQCTRIMNQHQAEIREGYKAYLCKTYGFNPQDLDESELDECMREDLQELSEQSQESSVPIEQLLKPAYYALYLIQQYHKNNPEWAQKSKDDFFYADSGKGCYDNGVRFEDFENLAGETNIYWALYQAGLIFMQTEPDFAMFCFKHLLILSNDKDPTFLPSFESSPQSDTIRCLRVAFKMLSNHYLNRYMIKQAQALSNTHFIQY